MPENKSIITFVNEGGNKQHIEKTLGDKTPQFISSIASLVGSNPTLAKCNKGSILSSCLIAASLDLPINQNLGFAYIIPYKNKGEYHAQFQMGYKGFIQLAMRSGQFRTINVTEVKEGEIKSQNRLTGEIEFDWIKEDREKALTIGYVAYMELLNGFSKQLYMTNADINKHAKRFSQSFKSGGGIWKEYLKAMSSKTVIKLLLSKYAPMTIEMQQATLSDQAIVTDKGLEYPDNEPVDATDEATERERVRIIKHIENSITVAELKKCEKAIEYESQEIEDLYNKKLKELK